MKKVHSDCVSLTCDWTEFKQNHRQVITCNEGKGDCLPFTLLQAEASSFHDDPLIWAVEQINAIVAAIPEHPEGATLSAILVPGVVGQGGSGSKGGILLAWVHQGLTPIGEQVTSQSPPDVIAHNLKLVD